jgi:hypothetical protein
MMTTDRIGLQNAEFDALEVLIKSYQRLREVAVVEDDYPEYRHYYERAIRMFIHALRENGRLETK